MALDTALLQKTISETGLRWTAVTPGTHPHALGFEPTSAALELQAQTTARILLETRVTVNPAESVMSLAGLNEAQLSLLKLNTVKVTAAAAAASLPAQVDWRTHNIIGPSKDQENCGSCVSFSTTGLLEGMTKLEYGASNLVLSAADQHFCSSHGANCGGWNFGDALGQLKSRGVVPEPVFPYNSGFDNPPKMANPSDPNSLWTAYCRGEVNRKEVAYRMTDYSGWTAKMPGISFDGRKYYLANFGPMVLSFNVYEDFDSYGGGVYKHTSGKLRGGHAVLVVGYSDAHAAWICRNSWNWDFGGNKAAADGTGLGFFMIDYNDSVIDGTFYGCHGVVVPQGSRLASRVGDMNGDGRAEILISSAWGLGVLAQAGNTFACPMLQPNGTRFGGWLLSTQDNDFGPMADYDGDGKTEVLVTSAWGLGVLKLAGGTMAAPMMAPNGTKLGGWTLDTTKDVYGPAADFDGDGHVELFVTNGTAIGLLKLSGTTMTTLAVATNGTHLGNWNLDATNNQFGPAADLDGDHAAELFVASPWGVGMLKYSGGALHCPMLQPNGTVLGAWRVNSLADSYGQAGDYDGDGKAEILATSPWGIGLLKLNGATMSSPSMAANGTGLGKWKLATGDDVFGPAGDYDGDGHVEVLVTSSGGLALLKQAGNSFTSIVNVSNGTRLGAWLMSTTDDRIGIAGVYGGGRQADLLVTSAWGIGILQYAGGALNAPTMQPNGTRFGGWLYSSADNRV